MTRECTVLVSGAYGLVGRELVRMLLEKTDARVIATGRKTERLASLAADLAQARVPAGDAGLGSLLTNLATFRTFRQLGTVPAITVDVCRA